MPSSPSKSNDNTTNYCDGKVGGTMKGGSTGSEGGGIGSSASSFAVAAMEPQQSTLAPSSKSYPILVLPLLIRIRRDKRRHVVGSNKELDTPTATTTGTGVNQGEDSSSGYISLHHLQGMIRHGPIELLSYAVKYDESKNDEIILKTPLETGRLYNTDPYLFVRALEQLYEQSQPHRVVLSLARSKFIRNISASSSSSNNNQPQQSASYSSTTTKPSSLSSNNRQQSQQGNINSNNNQRLPPDCAFTPIILSGLLSIIKEQRDENNKEASGDDVTSELVLTCQNMRRAAISRIRMRKKRYQIQRIVIPIVSVSILFVLYLRTMSDMRSLLIQLGYVKSCDGMPAYAPACFLAEAALWYKYRDYLLILRKVQKECRERTTQSLSRTDISVQCTQEHPLLLGRYREAPFTLHTTLTQDLISLEELDTGKFTPYLSTVHKRRAKGKASTSLRWLGDSTVNRLVREAVEEYLPIGMGVHVLDAGCGVAGTLFALLPEQNYRKAIQEGNFSYHGVAASGAEIAFGRGLLSYHNLDTLDDGIILEQRSFEERLTANAYTVVVAIESLSFSRNVDNTISNLLRSLRPGGIFIMVDDVVYPTLKVATDEYTIRPSLFSHATWMNTFQGKCQLKVARDLSLEYEMLHETFQAGKTITSTNGGHIYDNYVHYDGSTVGGGSSSSSRTSDDDGHSSSWWFGKGNNQQSSSYSDASSSTNNYNHYGKHDLWKSSIVLDSSMSLILERWLATTGNAASQRLLELQDEKYLLDKLLRKRKDAYKQTILSYNFYVCIKQ